MRERRKKPFKITRYLIYNREGHNRRLYKHYLPAKNEVESNTSLNSNNNGNNKINKAQRKKLIEEMRKTLRKYTR